MKAIARDWAAIGVWTMAFIALCKGVGWMAAPDAERAAWFVLLFIAGVWYLAGVMK